MAASSSSSSPDAVPVHRNFFDSYASESTPAAAATAAAPATTANDATLLNYIHTSVIGRDRCIDTPFGFRRPTYVDYTASGKPLTFLEDYLRDEVLPTYANTHTLTSFTGLQTTLFRKEARDIVARSMRASKEDVVLFTGSGSTAALQLFTHILNLEGRQRRFQEAEHVGPYLIVILGPYEHHSNLLPWREAGAQIAWAREAESGGVDLEDLERQVSELANAHPHALRIGSFSAASNVSGLLTDSNGVSRVLHRHGFLSVWDYASAAPYVEVDANPGNDPSLAKDAIIVSCHKFIGGPGSSGCLLVKKKHLSNRVPSTPGGGTVFFVSEERHRYLENAEEREEGGTPDILGGIRAGLVWQLRESVGVRMIASKEVEYARRGVEALTSEPNIVLMGHPSAPRLPIFSFLIRFDPLKDIFLHSGFVSALLNDLFGLQTRSGCLCAGPYAQKLLGMESTQQRFEDALVEKYELLRPGFVRFNLGWWLPETEVSYILEAIKFVAKDGWRFLPLYGFIVDSGEWKHRSRLRKNLVGRHWLSNISYRSGKMSWEGIGTTKMENRFEQRSDEIVFKEYREEAIESRENLIKNGYVGIPEVESAFTLPTKFEDLRWFILPNEVMRWVRDEKEARNKQIVCTSLKPRQSIRDASVDVANTSIAAGEDAGKTSSNSDALKLIAPTAAATPQPSTATPAPTPASSSTSSSSSSSKGQKRPAPTSSNVPSKNQLKRDAKKQKKDAADDEVKGKANDGDDDDGDGRMEDVPSSRDVSSKKRFVTSDLKEDVCKNCWHVHWNSSDVQARAEANGTNVVNQTLSTKECPSCPCITYVPSRAKGTKEIGKVTNKIQKTVGKAIKDYGMIKDGDKVLIGISGGKDSLTLFHILRNLQRKAPVRFELGCVTVDPQTPEYDPSPLKAYFASMGVPYFYESQPILEMAKEKMNPGKQSICAFCSRMKRGILYTCLRREGYNVLALGQHLDDLAESLLMSVFHNGMLRTMKANYHAEAGDIRIIRPLIYVRERLTREYSNLADLPVINENCVVAGTLVALSGGTSMPVELLTPGLSVLACVDGQVAASSTGAGSFELAPLPVQALMPRGTRECIELLFADGRTLRCTPEHLVLTDMGQWVQADKLEMNQSYVAVGMEYPAVDPRLDDLTSAWKLPAVSHIGFDFDIGSRREESHAIARLTGYMMTDGTMQEAASGRTTSSLYLGHLMDVHNVIADVKALTGITVVYRHQSNTYTISLPDRISAVMSTIAPQSANRIDSVTHYPLTFRDPSCPLSVCREYLGGLFGGDGTTLCLNHVNHTLEGLGYVVCKKGAVARAQVTAIRDELVPMLERCGVPKGACVIVIRPAAGYGANKCGTAQVLTDDQEPKADATYMCNLRFHSDAFEPFLRTVGFRYCVHKQMRLTVGGAWFRARDYCQTQRRILCERVLKMRETESLSIGAALARAKGELAQTSLLHPAIATWMPDEVKVLKQPGVHGPITVQAALQDWRLESFFSEQEPAQALPLFRVPVVAKRAIGAHPVYDVSVPGPSEKNRSYTAGGIVVHNCPACFEAPKERQRVKLLLASQENVHPNLYSNMLQAMRPLLGMENYRYKAPGMVGDDDGDADDGGIGMTPGSATNDLLKALRTMNGRTEEEEEDAQMDALCRAPGGACALPPKKTKQQQTTTTPAAAAAAPAAGPSTQQPETPVPANASAAH